MAGSETQSGVGSSAHYQQNVVANIRLKCLEYANSLNRDAAEVVDRARVFEAYVLDAPQNPPKTRNARFGK